MAVYNAADEGSKYDRFRVRDEDLHLFGHKKPRVRTRGARFLEPYVLVAMSVRSVERARKAHAAAPVVLLAIKRAYDLKGLPYGEPLAVTEAVTAGFGVSSGTRVRAIRAMVAAGLMTAEWAGRRAPRIVPTLGLFGDGAP
jgi:hypothetical protein